MARGNIIIIEGPQGSGKSTMANFLRDNLASSNLYRLTGIKDKSESGLEKNKTMYLGLINYMESLEDTELNLIFDRTFFTEEVYSKLGYKNYNFDEIYERLLKKLSELDFNIYFVVLYLKDTEIYTTRLRRQHHQYQAFSKDNSVNQQNAYLDLLKNIKYKGIHKIKIATDDFSKAYKKLINEITILKESGIVYNGLNSNK
jgi:thymidylate kinase